MDQQFDKFVEKMPGTKVNTADAQEHIGEIECRIRFIKERCRSTRAIMLFKQIPKSFVIYLVYFFVMWINLFTAT